MKIKDIATIQIGYQFRGKIKPDSKGTHKVIQIKDIDDDSLLNPSYLFRVKPEGEVNRYIVCQGDVLFLSRGKNNLATPITIPLKDTIVSSYFYILKMKMGGIIPEYLAWYLNQPPGQNFIHSFARGSRGLIIPKKDFIEMDVEIPPMKTQKTILKLYQLQLKERQLLKDLTDKKDLLIQNVCLKAAKIKV